MDWRLSKANTKPQIIAMDKEKEENGNIWTKTNRTKSTERNWNLWSLVNLAKESKTKKVLERVVWEVLLKHRWDKETVKHSKCLDESQIAKVVFNVIQELVKQLEAAGLPGRKFLLYGANLGCSSWCPRQASYHDAARAVRLLMQSCPISLSSFEAATWSWFGPIKNATDATRGLPP